MDYFLKQLKTNEENHKKRYEILWQYLVLHFISTMHDKDIFSI